MSIVIDENNNLISYTLDTSNGSVILTGVIYNGDVYPFSCTIPNSVISIGNYAFQNADISSIIIPSSVTSIGDYVFINRSSLTSVYMPSVTRIGTYSFQYCDSLTSISMPLVTSIGSSAFLGCPINIQSLQQVYYQGFLSVKTNATYGLKSTTQSQIQAYNISDSTIISIPTPASGEYYIKFPNTITAIASNAATNATFITALTIPDSVAIIGANAFSGCSNLVTLILPDSQLLTLGQNAFFGTTVSSTSLQEIKTQGYTAINLREAGFSASDLRIALYTIADLRTANYPKNEILAAGYTASDFFNAGGYTATDLQPPFSNSDLLAAGFTIDSTTPVTPIICFNEGTKILCFIDGQEKEILIQNIRNGHLVKTLYDGYKQVCMIGTSVIDNPGTNERIKNRLFICKKEKYPELNEDLIITGCHSILVDEITAVQREQIIVTMGRIFITDRKYRLNAVLDDRAEPYNCAGKFNIYHIALVNEHYYSNYGIYANGLLVESCGQRAMKEFANMTFL